MGTKNRAVVLFNLGITTYKGRTIPDEEYTLYKELIKILEYNNTLTNIEKKLDDKPSNKVYYLENYSIIETNGIFNILFSSAKYNHVTEVINTETLTSRGKLKNKVDGDKERTHVSIRFIDEFNAHCLIEQNYLGITMSKIVYYFNELAQKYYESIATTRFYRIDSSIVPNDEFLKELSNMTKISIATFFVDKQDLSGSDFINFSGRNDIRNEIQVVVKPTRGTSITRNTIKDYYNSKVENQKIKRILVDGQSVSGPLCLDTEKMKTKHNIIVETEPDTGLVKTDSIFFEFKKLLIGDGYLEVAADRA